MLRIRLLILFFLVANLLIGCGRPVDVVAGLSQSEANDVVSALLSRDIQAKKVSIKSGYGVQVEPESLSKALLILKELGLPRPHHERMGDVFKKENLISSPTEERARYIHALSQELQMTLLNIDGIVSARVHVVLPEKFVPGEPHAPSSAAVFLKSKIEVGLEATYHQVKHLVANSIPGLSESKVAVVIIPSGGEESANKVADVQTGKLALNNSWYSPPIIVGLLLFSILVAWIFLFKDVIVLHANRLINFLARKTPGHS